MPYPFRNLIFEGRGLQILSYIGALEVLEDKGIIESIKRVCGTSFGALTALLVGLNYTPSECARILEALKSELVFGDSFRIIRDSNRLINHFGWYTNENLRTWVGNLIAKKTGNSNLTFYQLQSEKGAKGFRDMYFIGTNVATHFSEIFSHETTPRICVADAVCISMSLPLLYQPARSVRGDPYIDGGIIDSYPIKMFDRKKYMATTQLREHGIETNYYRTLNNRLKRTKVYISPYIYNKETLSFRLDTPFETGASFRDQSEPRPTEMDDFFEFTVSLINVMIEAQRNRHLHRDDWDRTIFIDTLGVRAFEFGIPDARKKQLVESGRKGTGAYLKWYENPNSTPTNRA